MTRRPRRAVVALALILAGACGSGDSSSSTSPSTSPPSTTSSTSSSTTVPATTTTAPAPRAPTAGEPLGVMVVGDSVTHDAAGGIEAALEATGAAEVRSLAALGFGLNPENALANWPETFPRALQEAPTDLVVVMVGSWDHLYVRRAGAAAYRGVVEEAVDVLTAGGAEIVWLGEPPSDPAQGEEELRQVVNGVYEQVAADSPGVAYVSLDTVLGDEQGAYVRSLTRPDGSVELLRKPDGSHICPDGARRVGQAVLDAVTPRWQIPAPDPAWVEGPWRSDPRYDDPPGGCVP